MDKSNAGPVLESWKVADLPVPGPMVDQTPVVADNDQIKRAQSHLPQEFRQSDYSISSHHYPSNYSDTTVSIPGESVSVHEDAFELDSNISVYQEINSVSTGVSEFDDDSIYNDLDINGEYPSSRSN